MSDLVAKMTRSKINIKVFNDLQYQFPDGRAENPMLMIYQAGRALPFPKRVVIFSPHPDDDVISMGRFLARLSEHGHEVHLAYQVSGNIAVFDHDAIRFLILPESTQEYSDVTEKLVRTYLLRHLKTWSLNIPVNLTHLQYVKSRSYQKR